MDKYIPLSVPSLKGDELKYVKECIDTEWVSSAGKYVDKFEQDIASYTGSKYAVACVNGTSAIQVSLRLAGVMQGDEVIIPTLTFIAPVNAIWYNNASPVFMDCDDFYNIDVQKTIEFIKNETVFRNGYTFNKTTNKKISAIIPVHIWGNACDLNDLLGLCRERKISIIEDSSESLGTFYNSGELKNKHSGSIGKFGCISFNGNKIITTGGGGMIITDNEKLAEKAKYITTQAKNDPIRYIHDEIGYNFRLTNIQAALGVAQLEKLPQFLDHKKTIHKKYFAGLNTIEGLEIAKTPSYANNNHWLNILKINEKEYRENRESLMVRLESNGIQSRPIWGLNHLQKPYKDCQNYRIECSINHVSSSLCLPSSSNLETHEIERIISVLDHS
tara:strand:+ start:549 stop:1712 length:1164 start_codon:yes stop_codon:yes gene_type:complete